MVQNSGMEIFQWQWWHQQGEVHIWFVIMGICSGQHWCVHLWGWRQMGITNPAILATWKVRGKMLNAFLEFWRVGFAISILASSIVRLVYAKWYLLHVVICTTWCLTKWRENLPFHTKPSPNNKDWKNGTKQIISSETYFSKKNLVVECHMK
jgi:hypothetical protein